MGRMTIRGIFRLFVAVATFLPVPREQVSQLPNSSTAIRPQVKHTPARSRYERRFRDLRRSSESEELEQLEVGGLSTGVLLEPVE